MKYFQIQIIALSILMISGIAVAQDAQMRSPSAPTDQELNTPIKKEPHKDLNTYIDIGLMLIVDEKKLTDEQKKKYINQKLSIEKQLTSEERAIANETMLFRLEQFKKKEPKRTLPPELRQSIDLQKNVIESEMNGAMSNAKTKEEKVLIQNMYKERILQLESQFQ